MPYKDPTKRAEFLKQYYLKNKEKFLKRSSQRYAEKKDEIKAYGKEYHKKNREKKLQQMKVYRTTNKEKVRASIDAWMSEHKEEYKAWKKEWTKGYAKKNRSTIYARDVKRRQLKKDSFDETTDMEAIKQFYLLAENLTEKFGEKYVVDHIFPISKGGKHHQDNLQVITASDNLRKGAKYPFEVKNNFNPDYLWYTHT